MAVLVSLVMSLGTRRASLFARKPLDLLRQQGSDEDPLRQPGEGPQRLVRSLSAWDLMAMGIGAIIGAGIFSSTGTAVAGTIDRIGAGPALSLSYLVTAVACGFAALCYAEFAALIPMSGSAYTYSYVTMGELTAWVIGWDLVLEYAVGNIAVAVSWSGYFRELLAGLGWKLPDWLCTGVLRGLSTPAIHDAAPRIFGIPIIFNLPALLIVALLTWLLILGVKESAQLNKIMVAVKLVVVLGFLVVGVRYVQPENWRPFAPNGFTGVMTGAAVVFFSYIGFDTVSTVAEEAKNPQRDLPIGLIGSLLICTVLYVAVTLVLTGLLPWRQLGSENALVDALAKNGIHWAAGLLAFGAVIAMTAVLLVFQLGQPRIFYSMARDGLLPPWFAKLHPRYHTPANGTIVTGIIVGVPAAVLDLSDALDVCNIGTLFAFALVSAGVLLLRRSQPELPRPFRCPGVPLVPLASILCCGLLMRYVNWKAWVFFAVWLVVGLAFYLLYGERHSRLRQPPTV